MKGLQTARFGPLDVAYDERVLTPRDWTLLQSDWAVELSPSLPSGPILELCAGAGQIGMVVAYETGRQLIQVEEDAIAAQFALTNASALALNDYQLRCAPMIDAVSRLDHFPLILADPPYVPSGEVGAYPEDPPAAIDGGPDGLALIRDCLLVTERCLMKSGALLLQVRGERQAYEVAELAVTKEMDFELTNVRAHDHDRAVALLTRD